MAGSRKMKGVSAKPVPEETGQTQKQGPGEKAKPEHLTIEQEKALKMEQEEFRHGGIPLGSDPRE